MAEISEIRKPAIGNKGGELHLFIVWHNALDALEAIQGDLSATFILRRHFKVIWTAANFAGNITRFYGQNLPRGSEKEKHCGTGPFHAFIVEDTSPVYGPRKTSRGVETVNTNVFDIKAKYRTWTGGGHRIHASNNTAEAAKDVWLLLGTDLESFGDDLETTPEEIRSDLVGATGWKSLDHLFQCLNRFSNYVVIRNFESFPQSYFVEQHGDIDLLVDDVSQIVYLTNARKAHSEDYRVHYYVDVGEDTVPFDFRYVGDDYYDRSWYIQILRDRVLHDHSFFKPGDSDYFYSLLYHALIHKPDVSVDYSARLVDLGKRIGLPNENLSDSKSLRETLYAYLDTKRYRIPKPEDSTVFYNLAVVKGFEEISAIQRMPDSEASVFSMVRNAYDVSTFSSELRVASNTPFSAHLLGSQRHCLIRSLGIKPGDRVLEIGCEGGAITRYLGEIGAQVTAVENSPSLAQIASERCRDLENVTLVDASFFQLDTTNRFDWILHLTDFGLRSVSLGDVFATYLCSITPLMAPSGRLVIAANNKFGIRCFNGVGGNRPGSAYCGIQGISDGHDEPMIDRKSLTEAISATGLRYQQFHYPFPTRENPQIIFTELDDPEFNAADMLTCVGSCNGGGGSSPMFDDRLALRELAAAQRFAEFNNSFLVVATNASTEDEKDRVLAVSYSVQRRPEFSTRTRFVKSENCIRVKKEPLVPEASRTWQFGDGRVLEFVYGESEYISGDLSHWRFRSAVARGARLDEMVDALSVWFRTLLQHALLPDEPQTAGRNVQLADLELPEWCLDLTPLNLIEREQGPVPIDVEWIFNRNIPFGWVVSRSVLNSLAKVGRPTSSIFEIVASLATRYDLTVSDREIEQWLCLESELQAAVTGADIFDLNPVLPLGIFDPKPALPFEPAPEAPDTQGALAAALLLIAEMRRSRSWRWTAPLRLLGHLRRGNFYGIGAAFRARLAGISLAKNPSPLRRLLERWVSRTGDSPTSRTNRNALAALVDARCEATQRPLKGDPLSPPPHTTLPALDISIVTYNSARWVEDFVKSLLAVDYPRELVSIVFVDNGSSDATVQLLQAELSSLHAVGFKASLLTRPNYGYGAGHNVGIAAGSAEFCLVTNIDLTFEKNSLATLASIAATDGPAVAAWEMRQTPYEHPKFYDPVTGLTNWNSHACVLLRRSAVKQVGGYDEALFMYGEDVELSYRLRRTGFLLRYCAGASVHHYTYAQENQVKPLQYIGSTFANLYLRLKYGTMREILTVPGLAARLLFGKPEYPGAKKAVFRNILILIAKAPRAIALRQSSTAFFPFRQWDYEIARDGAFVKQTGLPQEKPLVSIITRTYRGREQLLRQALLSVAHQTYPNVEHIVVEDGGETMRTVVENVSETTRRPIRYISQMKLGRSATGNNGLAAASGRWCLFLDDDDLLFSDHIETLVRALLADPDAVAAFSLAWEVATDFRVDRGFGYTEESHFVPPLHRREFDFDFLLHHNFMPIQSVLFERQLFKKRGGFLTDMNVLEDWLLWLNYARGNKFVHVPRVTSLYRVPAEFDKIADRIRIFNDAYPLARARAQALAKIEVTQC